MMEPSPHETEVPRAIILITFLDKAWRCTADGLEQVFIKRRDDIYASKALKRPKKAIKRLQEEYGISRVMRGFPG